MKIIFAGTPEFAARALDELLKEHRVLAVLTQPDRPSGRGMQLKASPVKLLAQKHAIPVLQPVTLKSLEVQNEIAALNADVMIVAAYGLILPKSVLQIPHYGCLNIHASLLPRWRGAAPIQRAILAGDAETGITIMQMDEGLDTGDMLLKKTCAIEENDTTQTLHDKLAELGAKAIIETLELMERNQLQPQKQDAQHATYAAKIMKSESMLVWGEDAVTLERSVRGYFPYPAAMSTIHKTPIKVLRASTCAKQGRVGAAGTVMSIDNEHIVVACGEGALSLEVLQKPGGKPLPAHQFLQSFQIKVGDSFGNH